jgi:dolichol kinase
MEIIGFILAYNVLYVFCETGYRSLSGRDSKERIVAGRWGNTFCSVFRHREFWRKIAHIGTGSITFFSLGYLEIPDYLVLFAVFIVSFFIIRKYRLFKFLEGEGRGYGDLYFIAGQLVAVLFLRHDIVIAQVGLLVLTFADGLAPLGKFLWDKKTLHGKTYGGSLVFFVTSFAVAFAFYGWDWRILLVSAI